MRGVCIAILKGNSDAADDLVHDAFILAFASMGKLKNPSRFGQWLTTITRNVAFKYLEQNRRNPLIPLSEVPIEQLDISDETETIETHVSLNELLALINRLPDGYRNVFRMSVIEGFTHKEIADMLGIEPHSSSSQLSRAKVILRKMLSGYLTLVVLVVVMVFTLYKIYHKKPTDIHIEKGSISKAEEPRDKKVTINNDIIVSEKGSDESDGIITVAEVSRPDFTYVKITDILNDENCYDGVVISEPVNRDSAEYVTDTLLHNIRPTFDTNITEHSTKKRKWKMMLAGSLGPALAQNAYKLIVGSDNADSESGVPVNISTWEEYYDYLQSRSHDNMPADSVALMNIAKNNSGDIIEHENHEKPITFGISFSKTLNDRWSMETGLQYSLLRSSFTMGSGMNSIQRSQKLHYIGIPIKVSYKIADYRRFSAYASVGTVVNIPVKGRIRQSLVTDTTTMYLEGGSVSPSWQLSVNASLGVQYELKRNISIYFEPTLNYYIPSGSDTHSIWTEQPFTVTMPLGIRFTW